MNNTNANLGITIKQLVLGVTSEIWSLGIVHQEGSIPVPDGLYIWVFGDDSDMLFGDGTYMEYTE
jgi:hypothetical protein